MSRWCAHSAKRRHSAMHCYAPLYMCTNHVTADWSTNSVNCCCWGRRQECKIGSSQRKFLCWHLYTTWFAKPYGEATSRLHPLLLLLLAFLYAVQEVRYSWRWTDVICTCVLCHVPKPAPVCIWKGQIDHPALPQGPNTPLSFIDHPGFALRLRITSCPLVSFTL